MNATRCHKTNNVKVLVHLFVFIAVRIETSVLFNGIHIAESSLRLFYLIKRRDGRREVVAWRQATRYTPIADAVQGHCCCTAFFTLAQEVEVLAK